jgi:hypothetical protein
MKPSRTLLLPLLLIRFANAQQSFAPGYIVTDKNDTIKGEVRINPKKPHDVYSKVYFKDPKGIQKNYRPEKIKGYGVNTDTYLSLDSDGEPLFYKVLVTGYINFYKLEFETIRMNNPVFEFEYYFTDPESEKGKLVVVKENKFKKQISEYMEDNPEIAQDYSDDGKNFDPEKAAEVIAQYNAWKTGQPVTNDNETNR